DPQATDGIHWYVVPAVANPTRNADNPGTSVESRVPHLPVVRRRLARLHRPGAIGHREQHDAHGGQRFHREPALRACGHGDGDSRTAGWVATEGAAPRDHDGVVEQMSTFRIRKRLVTAMAAALVLSGCSIGAGSASAPSSGPTTKTSVSAS